MRIKQSVCFPIFRSRVSDLDALFAAAAEIGYAAVEFWARGDDYEEVIETAHKHGLVVASACVRNVRSGG